MWKRLVLVSFMQVFFAFVHAQAPVREHIITGHAQGTTYTVRYFSDSEVLLKATVDSLLQVIDKSMSLYRSDSDISAFNRSATGITMDVHMAKVMQKVVEVHALSGGQFDPTVAPLVKLWGFDDMKLNLNVSRTDITAALVNVGMKFLKVQGNELVKLKPAVTIDLNGIAQGYSVDLMADLLVQRGVTSFLVELGGEIAVGGPKPDGRPYTVAIERPIKPGAEATTRILQLKKGAVTTSGNYRRFLTGKNGTIGHLINPKTGYSFDNGMISVTVIAPDALTADAYDNVFMGMGVKATLKLLEKMKGVEVYMIYRDGKGVVRETMSPTFRQFLERLD